MGSSVAQETAPPLDLNEIQGDLLIGMQKNAELFLFFKIVDVSRFRARLVDYVAPRITSARLVIERERRVAERRRAQRSRTELWPAMNLGFTRHGLTRLFGADRPPLEASFERGADDPDTIAALNDPPLTQWLAPFRSDRTDGVFLVTGPDANFVGYHAEALRHALGPAIQTVYAETGTVRPGRQRGHEHFGFRDGISQPGIRGVTRPSNPTDHPNQGLPGQDLIWPGEFVFGYPGQAKDDPVKAGPPPKMAAPWMKNGSLMVFRRLEQEVPEFWRFVAAQAARLGMERELLGGRMVGRWQSGAPMELAPLRDNPVLAADPKRNNNFDYRDDPFQRKCPYAAHIRKANPRDDTGNLAAVLRHRIMRAGIPFGPEVKPDETTTRHSRGLMFVCYQTSIERQFEWVQRRFSNDPHFVSGKVRPTGGAVTPGYDPIIGQAPDGGPRAMDEPYPNYPTGNRRSTLDMPHQFVVLTAAAYFFMPSIAALRTVLAR